jgi:Protein of unknown function (DUF1236)
MRNKLLITTAALLGGVALASAQSMQGGGEQRGGATGATQGQESQSSPQRGQSQQAPQTQREQGAQGQRDQGMQQDRGQQSPQSNQGQRDQSTDQTPQRQQGQQGQTGQAPQQGQGQQGQAQQGKAGGSANLTTQQRTQVRQTVLAGRNVPRVNSVNFSLSAGTTVPTSVRVVAVPPTLIEIYPEWRGHMYFVVGDQIIIVDRSHRIIAIIDV